ncbi:hypothetical protein ACFVYA_37625 [Amycolatopsis sp. NPDC058278]|uniref:hypothetical protein n=1 Tax=Amycolatopsis sp. NPDC058278 TaxID=3346417 RepID=UPI0036DEE9CA
MSANATVSKPARKIRPLTAPSASPARTADELLDVGRATEQQMLTFQIIGEDLPKNYWADDRCGNVAKMAEAVISNLRQP